MLKAKLCWNCEENTKNANAYHNNWFKPLLKANRTSTYKKKNFMMSVTMRDNDTCKGPRCGFTEKM